MAHEELIKRIDAALEDEPYQRRRPAHDVYLEQQVLLRDCRAALAAHAEPRQAREQHLCGGCGDVWTSGQIDPLPSDVPIESLATGLCPTCGSRCFLDELPPVSDGTKG